MGQGTPQSSFTSGELAPSLYGRVDFARYYTALKTCRNYIVRPYGGVINRAGTHLAAEVKSSSIKGRLIPFEFSSSQSYALEFGDYIMRIFKDGGIVVWPLLPVWVTGTVYAVGDKRSSGGVNYNCLTAHTSGVFATDLAAVKWTVAGVVIGTPVEVVTPFPWSELPYLKYAQSNDVLTIAHPSIPTQELIRFDHHLWTIRDYEAVGGPFQDINIVEATTVSSSGVTGEVTLTCNVDIFSADQVDLLFFLEQAPDATTKKWEVQKAILINDIRRAGVNYYQALSSGTTGTVRPTVSEGIEYDGDPGVPWKYLHSGSGIVKITEFLTTKTVKGTVQSRLPDLVISGTIAVAITGVTAGMTPVALDPGVNVRLTISAHGYVNGQSVTIAGVLTGINGTWQVIVVDANTIELSGCYIEDITGYTLGTSTLTLSNPLSYKWAFGAWGIKYGYPGAVGYDQERMIFAGSRSFPHTFWMSRSQGFRDFGTSNPILDDDSITYKMNSNQLVEVRHILELSELIMLSTAGPFLIRGGTDGVIKPGGISRKKQPAPGSSHVAPLAVGSASLYIQEKETKVRNLGYVFQDDAFTGQDLTALSNHLFLNRTIVSWCYQGEPFSAVWVILDNGLLLSLAYLPEQEVIGWSWHDTDGLFESCCAITEDGKDRVYFQVKRTINGADKRFIERMAPRLYAEPEDAFFVDCGLTYRGAPATIISGLDHLEGKTVSILADGNVHPQRVVTAGAITLDRTASKVHVGLPYVSDFETLPIASAQADIRDKKKIINHVSLIVENSRGIWAGPDADHLTEAKREAFTAYTDTKLQTTGLLDFRIQATWNKVGNVFTRQVDPLPMSILNVIPEVTYGGS